MPSESLGRSSSATRWAAGSSSFTAPVIPVTREGSSSREPWRFDLERLVEGFRRAGGDEVAEIARRHFGVAPVGPEEWARCYRAFGPNLLTDDQLARRIRNPDVGLRGMRLLQELDVLDQVALIESPTLVCVGELEAGTPVSASQEIADALPAGIGRLEVVPGAGHFTWLDAPDRYWPILEDFVRQTADDANS
jgi:pimeloyl-ACP methyl ester carboxylesterase